MNNSILAALSAFGSASQERRLLRLDFPQGDGPADTVLMVNSLQATEAVSRDFRFEVELLSDDAHIALTDMMGRMVTISMVRDRSEERRVGKECPV